MALTEMNYTGAGGTDLKVRAQSRINDPNKPNTRTYSIPSGIKKVVVVLSVHKAGSISGVPSVTWNGNAISYDSYVFFDYTSINGWYSGATVTTYILDGNGGSLVVSATDTYYDSCCIY